MNIKGANRNIICKPEKIIKAIRSKVTRGFATIEQKSSLVGLSVMADSKIGELEVTSGDTVYVLEEVMHSVPQYTSEKSCDAFEEPFVVIDSSHVVMVKKAWKRL